MKTTNDDFTGQLLHNSAHFWHDHAFHIRLHEGKLSRAAVKAWVANRYYYQKCIPLKDAAILANCPDPSVRRRWAGRLIAQDGDHPGTGEIAEWHQLALAAGVSESELVSEVLVVPGVRFAADAYVSFARQKSWLEGVAASITQAKAAEVMSLRTAAFERAYSWVDSSAVAYFNARKARLAREGDEALALLREFCLTPEQQQLARAAVTFKSNVLWAMLDALDHALRGSE